MDVIVTIVIAVVITAAYLVFSVYNIFISKKQIDVSLIDLLFYIFAAFIFTCSLEFNITGLTLAVMLFVPLWSLGLIYFLDRNEKCKKEPKVLQLTDDKIKLQIGGIIVEREFKKDDKQYVATNLMNFEDTKEES